MCITMANAFLSALVKGRLTDEVRLESVTFDDMEQVEVCPGKERNEGMPQQDRILV